MSMREAAGKLILANTAHSFMNESVYIPLTTMGPISAIVARSTLWLLSISGVFYAAEH